MTAWPGVGPRPAAAVKGAGPPGPAAPAPLRLLGAKRYASRPSAPGSPSSARRPVPRCSLGAAAGPPALRGFGCRLRRHRCAVSVPAPACCLGLSAPAAARHSAAASGPRLPRCGPGCGPARLGAWALARFLPFALGCCVWASGPPSAACGLRPAPWAAPSSRAPRRGPGSAGLRCAWAPWLPPGASGGPPGRFFRPPGPGRVGGAGAPLGLRIPPLRRRLGALPPVP